MGLKSIERTLERVVDSVFSRSSRRTLRPVELGRKLLQHMEEHRSVDVKGRRLVPNVFTFYLSPADHAALADIDIALRHELAEAAREYAHEEDFGMVGPVSVVLEVDEHMKPGRCGIFSHMREAPLDIPPSPELRAALDSMPPAVDPPMPPVIRFDSAPQPPVEAPQPKPADESPFAPAAASASQAPATPAAPAPTVPPSLFDVPDAPDLAIDTSVEQPVESLAAGHVPTEPGWVILGSGDRIPVDDRPVVFGRLPDCTVILNDPNVSRHHAEIRPGATFMLVDLGSTNGTLLNGERISSPQPLNDGDVITMGQSHVRFEAP